MLKRARVFLAVAAATVLPAVVVTAAQSGRDSEDGAIRAEDGVAPADASGDKARAAGRDRHHSYSLAAVQARVQDEQAPSARVEREAHQVLSPKTGVQRPHGATAAVEHQERFTAGRCDPTAAVRLDGPVHLVDASVLASVPRAPARLGAREVDERSAPLVQSVPESELQPPCHASARVRPSVAAAPSMATLQVYLGTGWICRMKPSPLPSFASSTP